MRELKDPRVGFGAALLAEALKDDRILALSADSSVRSASLVTFAPPSLLVSSEKSMRSFRALVCPWTVWA